MTLITGGQQGGKTLNYEQTSIIFSEITMTTA